VNYRAVNGPIAREAWPFFAAAVIPMLVAFFFRFHIVGVILLLVAVYILFFFRNPKRPGTAVRGAVIAPADGKVVAAGVVANPDFDDGQALRIAVFMNLFNCHMNWAPYSGSVEAASHHCGRFLNAMEDKCAEENERKILLLRSPDNILIQVKLVAGLVARRIVCPLEKGDRVDRGDKIGLIRFGSRVETILPANAVLRVRVGEMVKGGETVIAELSTEGTGQLAAAAAASAEHA
jgi:phosphatidylserine decarboxylase